MMMLMTTQAHNEHCDDADEANQVCVNYGNDDGNDDCITIMLVVMLTMEVHDEGNAAHIYIDDDVYDVVDGYGDCNDDGDGDGKVDCNVDGDDGYEPTGVCKGQRCHGDGARS